MPYVIVGLFVVVAGWLVLAYNNFVRGKNIVKEAWSGIDVQLKRRYDLIPNLIETVKGYAQHEKQLFENISKFRSESMNAGSIKEKSEAENQLTGTLRTLFAVAEAYPELKANQNFLELQRSLADIEDQLQLARRYYNGAARNYNISIASFPNVLIAGAFGFHQEEYFQVENAEERKTPEVKF